MAESIVDYIGQGMQLGLQFSAQAQRQKALELQERQERLARIKTMGEILNAEDEETKPLLFKSFMHEIGADVKKDPVLAELAKEIEKRPQKMREAWNSALSIMKEGGDLTQIDPILLKGKSSTYLLNIAKFAREGQEKKQAQDLMGQLSTLASGGSVDSPPTTAAGDSAPSTAAPNQRPSASVSPAGGVSSGAVGGVQNPERTPPAAPSWEEIARRDPKITAWFNELRSKYPDIGNTDVVTFMKQGMKGEAGYNYARAIEAGARPDIDPETKELHWPSNDPRDGTILKGRGHPTYNRATQPAAPSGGAPAAPQPIQKVPDAELVQRYAKMQAITARLSALNPQMATHAEKLLKDMKESGWRDRRQPDGTVVQYNIFTNEMGKHYTPAETFSAPRYEGDNIIQQSSRGRVSVQQKAETFQTTDENDLAITQRSSRGKVQVEKKPERFTATPVPGGVSNVSTSGKQSFEAAPITWNKVGEDAQDIRLRSSTGEEKIIKKSDVKKSTPIFGTDGQEIGVRIESSDGAIDYKTAPQTFAAPIVRDGNVLQRSSSGKLDKLYELKGNEVMIPKEDPIYQGQPQGTVFVGQVKPGGGGYEEIKRIAGPTPTEYPPGQKKAADLAETGLDDIRKNLDQQRKVVNFINMGINASGGAGDLGAYQPLKRFLQSYLQPVFGGNTDSLASGELLRSAATAAPITLVSTISDRPNALQTRLAQSAIFQETTSPEGKRLIADVFRNQLRLNEKIYNAAAAWNDAYGSLNNSTVKEGQIYTLQDKLREIADGHDASEETQKLIERIDGIKPPPSSTEAPGGKSWREMQGQTLIDFAASPEAARLPRGELIELQKRLLQERQQQKRAK